MRQSVTAIVGAGPYGLSLAAHMRANGIPHEIYGRTMTSWRDNMPVGMSLRSEPFASNLWDPERRFTLEAFCRTERRPCALGGRPLPLSEFLEYSAWFQRNAVPGVEDLHLERLTFENGGYTLRFSGGEIRRARNVVVATGHAQFRYIPPAIAALPDELVWHSDGHRDFSRFKDKDVIVVGGGQSAVETAALLHEQGAGVRLLVREDDLKFTPTPLENRSLFDALRDPESGLGPGWLSLATAELPQAFRLLPRDMRYRILAKAWGPSSAYWLKDRIDGKVPVLTSHEVIGASEHNGKARLVVRAGDGSCELEADHVVAATGFKPDLAKVPFLDSALLQRIASHQGRPALTRGFESSAPGLHFVGHLSAPTFGPVMRFMFGAKRAAPALARKFAERAGLPWLTPLPWQRGGHDEPRLSSKEPTMNATAAPANTRGSMSKPNRISFYEDWIASERPAARNRPVSLARDSDAPPAKPAGSPASVDPLADATAKEAHT